MEVIMSDVGRVYSGTGSAYKDFKQTTSDLKSQRTFFKDKLSVLKKDETLITDAGINEIAQHIIFTQSTEKHFNNTYSNLKGFLFKLFSGRWHNVDKTETVMNEVKNLIPKDKLDAAINEILQAREPRPRATSLPSPAAKVRERTGSLPLGKEMPALSDDFRKGLSTVPEAESLAEGPTFEQFDTLRNEVKEEIKDRLAFFGKWKGFADIVEGKINQAPEILEKYQRTQNVHQNLPHLNPNVGGNLSDFANALVTKPEEFKETKFYQ